MNFMPAAQMISRAQRAVGRLDLSFQARAGQTRIEKFYQEGCLRARVPRADEDGICDAVTLNISGGVAGGDVLDIGISAGPGARVRVAAQAAERIYRALEAPARIQTRIRVGVGAQLDYLPQETIFFDGFGLLRSLDIELAADADFLGVETLVFGRRAMGEVLVHGSLRDKITLRRDGRLLLQDMTRLDGDVSAILARKGVAGGAMAMASVILAGPGAADRLALLRDVLEDSGLTAGASVIEGVVFARLLAPAASLRNCVVAVLRACRDGRALPRVWQG
jgi:urease accessory protein